MFDREWGFMENLVLHLEYDLTDDIGQSPLEVGSVLFFCFLYFGGHNSVLSEIVLSVHRRGAGEV